MLAGLLRPMECEMERHLGPLVCHLLCDTSSGGMGGGVVEMAVGWGSGSLGLVAEMAQGRDQGWP